MQDRSIWDLLRAVGLFPCDDGDRVEIDLIDDASPSVYRSFFFECIGLEDGTRMFRVKVAVKHDGKTTVTFCGLDAPLQADLDDIIEVIDDMEGKLRKSLMPFLKNRDDLR